MSRAWIWLGIAEALAIHEEQLAEHGGLAGIRDRGLLESALARPQQIAAYAGDAGIAELAAAYAVGIMRNHPFSDGNKRTGFVLMELFLVLNGYALIADDADCVAVMLGAAAGTISEQELTDWLRQHTTAA